MSDATIETRRLPVWAWLLAAAFFPAGTSLALAVGRVVRWPSAVALAVVWYAAAALAAPHAVPYIDAKEPRAAAIGMMFVLVAWIGLLAIGAWQYQLGKRRDYWTWQGRRIWKLLGIVALVLLVVNVLSLGAYLVLLQYLPPTTGS
jgi:hypothetical protein